ncbi:MAG: hypothetical protein C0582_00225 [Alphaproteobacteria bacterium]|nr:MAG: hypothetical protein C0582_00225 [Alphaproteobacteria bacterium]
MKTARIFILLIIFMALPKVSALADQKIDILTIGSVVPNQILSAAHKLLSRKGFSVGKDDKAKTAARTPFSIYMNTDEERFKHFLRSILSKSRVLWAARGGYGSQAVLRKFSKHPIHKDRQAARKFLIGSSDLTAAGLFMAHHHDWIFLHGPMLMHNEDLHSLRFKLTGSKVNQKASLKPVIKLLKKQSVDTLTYTLTPINAAAKKSKRSNNIQGPILGGNLSVIQRNIGGILKISLLIMSFYF